MKLWVSGIGWRGDSWVDPYKPGMGFCYCCGADFFTEGKGENASSGGSPIEGIGVSFDDVLKPSDDSEEQWLIEHNGATINVVIKKFFTDEEEDGRAYREEEEEEDDYDDNY